MALIGFSIRRKGENINFLHISLDANGGLTTAEADPVIQEAAKADPVIQECDEAGITLQGVWLVKFEHVWAGQLGQFHSPFFLGDDKDIKKQNTVSKLIHRQLSIDKWINAYTVHTRTCVYANGQISFYSLGIELVGSCWPPWFLRQHTTTTIRQKNLLPRQLWSLPVHASWTWTCFAVPYVPQLAVFLWREVSHDEWIFGWFGACHDFLVVTAPWNFTLVTIIKRPVFFSPVDRGVNVLRIFGEVQTQVSTRGHLWRIGKTFPFRNITW